MPLLRDDSGEVFSMLDCPHCDTPGPHLPAGFGTPGTFQCGVCMGLFSDAGSPLN